MKDSKEPKVIKKKNRFSKTWRKVFKEDSSLSLLKIAATALTAISMALISTQLTGFVSSIVLVGLVSIVSALVSEFYRVALSVTSLGAKKVIKPIIEKIPQSEQSEAIVQVKALLNKIEENTDNSLKSKHSLSEDKTPIEIKNVVVTELDLVEKDTYSDTTDTILSSSKYSKETTLKKRVSRIISERPFLKIALFFFLVSATTIGASYFISNANSGDVINYSTIKETKIEELPEKDKQDIINKTLSTAAARDVESESQLQTKIDKLSEENIKLSDKIDKLKTEQDEYKKTIENFEKRFVEIDSKIKPTPPASESPNIIIGEPVVPTEPGNTVAPAEPKLEDNAEKLNPEIDSDGTVKIEENEAL